MLLWIHATILNILKEQFKFQGVCKSSCVPRRFKKLIISSYNTPHTHTHTHTQSQCWYLVNLDKEYTFVHHTHFYFPGNFLKNNWSFKSAQKVIGATALFYRASQANVGDIGSSLGPEDPMEEEMATHSDILAYKISRTEKTGRLQSIVSQSQIRLSTNACFTRGTVSLQSW